MNVFVIHSGADYEATNRVISSLKQKVYSLNTLILKNGTCFWKIDASKKIKKSQMVLFVVGENSHKSPYIGWEIKEAIRNKKPILSFFTDIGGFGQPAPKRQQFLYFNQFRIGGNHGSPVCCGVRAKGEIDHWICILHNRHHIIDFLVENLVLLRESEQFQNENHFKHRKETAIILV